MIEKKCTVYGYEDYKHYSIQFGWLIADYRETHPNYYYYPELYRDWLIPGCLIVDGLQVPHIDELCQWGTDNSAVREFLGSSYRIPDNGNAIYFMDGCKLPRTKFKGQWKRAGRIDKADSIVIPDFGKWGAMHDHALFVNSTTKELWVMDIGYEPVSAKTFKKNCRIGDTFRKCVEKLSPKWYGSHPNDPVLQSSIANSTLVYKGTMWNLNLNQIPLLETLLGKLTNVVFESDLAELLDDTTDDELSVETFGNLYDQLKSRSSGTVIPALRSLASINYNKTYRNAVTLLLDMTLDGWYQYKDISVATKQMCRDLDFMGNPKFIHHHYEPVSKRELEAFSMLYSKKMRSDLMNVVRSYNDRTDAKVDIDCNISITL